MRGAGDAFSILYRIELAVTLKLDVKLAQIQPFSILYRIELAVTPGCIHPPLATPDFQYPLSDRTRCNGPMLPAKC